MSNSKKISIIVAASENNVIGSNNQLPWHISEDLKFFKNKTINNAIIMGYNTWISIGKILPNRLNIIISRKNNLSINNAKVFPSLEEGISFANKWSLKNNSDEVLIIGGGQLYKESLSLADTIYLTRIHATISGDTYFPEIDNQWILVSNIKKFDSKENLSYSFQTFKKIKNQYIKNNN